MFGRKTFGQQQFGQQQFGQQPQFGQQTFTGGFNTPQGDNTNNMNQQPTWPMSPGGSPAASDHSSFSSFSSQATNSPNTSYASSYCAADTRQCSPAPFFANAFQATATDPSTPYKRGTQPSGLPSPPPTQQPGSRFLPPTPAPAPIPTPAQTFNNLCSQCTTPLPIGRPLSCGHSTCPPCARSLFIRSMRTAAAGTPFAAARCCSATVLPLATAGTVLDYFEFTAYRERLIELAMAPDQRRYCHEPRCGMFLRMDRARSGQCALCGNRTCTRCGRRSHRAGCGPGTDFQTGKGCRPWIAEY